MVESPLEGVEEEIWNFKFQIKYSLTAAFDNFWIV